MSGESSSFWLSADHRRRLHGALLRAFPTRASFDELTDLQLDVPLEQIAGSGQDTRAIALALITWATSHGRLAALLAAVESARADNQEVQQIVREIRAAQAGAPPLPSPPAAPPAASAPTPPTTPPATPPAALPGGGAHPGSTAKPDPDPASPPTAGSSSSPPPPPPTGGYIKALIAFAMIAILALVGIFFARDSISPEQWGLAKTVLALAGAILAMFIPGVLNVRIGQWLNATGAMAVFVIIYFFPVPPPDPMYVTVTGYMFYKGTNNPAPNVVVTYPANNLKSNPTGTDGFFSLNGVPSGVNSLTWSFGGQSQAFELTGITGKSYHLIPRPPAPVDSKPVVVPSARWTIVKTCPQPTQAGERGRGFKLELNIPHSTEGPIAHLRVVVLRSDTRIQSWQMQPDADLEITAPKADPRRMRWWEFSSVPQDGRTLTMVLCLVRTGALPTAPPDLQTEYWYRKFE